MTLKGPLYSSVEKLRKVRREFEAEMAAVWERQAIDAEQCRCSRPVERGTYLGRKLCLCGGWIA